MENNQRVTSAVYFALTDVNNKPAMAPMAFVKVDKEWFDKIKNNPKKYKDQYEMLKKHDFDIEKVVRRLRLPEVTGEKTIEVNRVGLGAMLIHRDVMEKIKFRKNPNGFDDMTFCEDVLKNNWKLILDTGVKCQHFLEEGD